MRTYWLLWILIAFATPVHAVDGFDAPGGDYTNFESASAFVCGNTCGGDSRLDLGQARLPGTERSLLVEIARAGAGAKWVL